MTARGQLRPSVDSLLADSSGVGKTFMTGSRNALVASTRPARPDQPLMVQLADHRRDLRITTLAMAERLGVHCGNLNRWERGSNSPKFGTVVAYAEQVGRKVVLWDGSRAHAEGLAVPRALPVLRKAAGLTQRDMAPILHVQQPAVAMFETRGCFLLASIEAYAAGLGLRLALMPAEAVQAVAS